MSDEEYIKIEIIKNFSKEEIKNWSIEFLQERFIELQNIAIKGQDIMIKQQKELQLSNKVIDKRNQENVELAQEHLEKNEIINAMAKLIYSEVDCIEMGNMAKEINYNMEKLYSGIDEKEAIKIIKDYFRKVVNK